MAFVHAYRLVEWRIGQIRFWLLWGSIAVLAIAFIIVSVRRGWITIHRRLVALGSLGSWGHWGHWGQIL